MRWTCPVCEKENWDRWICEGCGYDESRNYIRYGSVGKLSERARREYEEVKKEEEQKGEEQQEKEQQSEEQQGEKQQEEEPQEKEQQSKEQQGEEQQREKPQEEEGQNEEQKKVLFGFLRGRNRKKKERKKKEIKREEKKKKEIKREEKKKKDSDAIGAWRLLDVLIYFSGLFVTTVSDDTGMIAAALVVLAPVAIFLFSVIAGWLSGNRSLRSPIHKRDSSLFFWSCRVCLVVALVFVAMEFFPSLIVACAEAVTILVDWIRRDRKQNQ